MKTLTHALKDVVARMFAGGVTGDEAWRVACRDATNEELLAWMRDPLIRESGCGYIADHIGAEAERRLDALRSTPLPVKIVDYGPKRSG